MVRILAEYNDFHFVKWSKFECPKHLLGRWKNPALFIFGAHKIRKFFKVVFSKFILKSFLPARLDLHIHRAQYTLFYMYLSKKEIAAPCGYRCWIISWISGITIPTKRLTPMAIAN